MPRLPATTPPAAPMAPAPSAWTAAVAAVLGSRDPAADHVFDDVESVTQALTALAATGRLVATYPGQALLPVSEARAAPQSEPGFSRFRDGAKGATRPLADTAFALLGADATWVVNVAALTYVAPRRGQPAERAVFHLWLGALKGVPFIHDTLPRALHFAGHQALVLAESDLDVGWLLRDGVDVSQAEEIGKALRGERPRAGYVPPELRKKKDDAIAAVRAAYLAHRGPRPRALAQPDIDVIVREGLAHGLLINLELVHAVTEGRGSPNAVYPKLADAMGRLAPRRPPDDDIDPALRAVWAQLQEAAKAAAAASLAPEREAIAAERAALEADRTALEAERAQEARANAERTHHLERLETELVSARERIESFVNVERGQAQEVARLSAERNALQGQLTDAGAALAVLQAEHTAQREAHERALSAERELTTAERDAAASARELAAAQIRDLNDRLAAARRETDSKLTELQATDRQVAELREALAAAQREAATSDTRRAAAEQALAETQSATTAASEKHASAHAALEQRLEAARAECATVQRALSNLEGEHRAVVRERDRLEQLLTRLGSPQAPGKRPR